MPVDRLERLVNLVAALIDTPHPLTREQIHERIDGYADDPDAFRRNFERDKELLRQMGLPLATVPLDPGRPDEVGYRIRREEYELADPGLDEHERAALRLASAAVQMEGDWGRDASIRALRKLGGAASDAEADGLGGLADLPGGDAVATVFGAVAERRRVRFQYRGQERLVDPWRLSYRRGQWYLAGFDQGRGGERLFRLDRVAGPVEVDGPPGAFDRPAAPDTGPGLPWRLGDDEEIEADLLVDVEQAPWAEEALGSEAVEERREDGSIRFRVALTNVGAFRSFVLGFLDHAEILGPPELRADMVAWLDQLAGDRG